ncbi:hypothetical protein KC909_05670 [Candidatus Dojkabacteria bacterium]|uniref:Uncharacterized protein n=1 Tax=Candidatus Dojkabacteria bacterium TaxID=2099670 RepID=A0A955L6L9_9BACT|nr:hypothetical protein [Candidatus Dojkabacteria bacterium]
MSEIRLHPQNIEVVDGELSPTHLQLVADHLNNEQTTGFVAIQPEILHPLNLTRGFKYYDTQTDRMINMNLGWMRAGEDFVRRPAQALFRDYLMTVGLYGIMGTMYYNPQTREIEVVDTQSPIGGLSWGEASDKMNNTRWANEVISPMPGIESPDPMAIVAVDGAYGFIYSTDKEVEMASQFAHLMHPQVLTQYSLHNLQVLEQLFDQDLLPIQPVGGNRGINFGNNALYYGDWSYAKSLSGLDNTRRDHALDIVIQAIIDPDTGQETYRAENGFNNTCGHLDHGEELVEVIADEQLMLTARQSAIWQSLNKVMMFDHQFICHYPKLLSAHHATMGVRSHKTALAESILASERGRQNWFHPQIQTFLFMSAYINRFAR